MSEESNRKGRPILRAMGRVAALLLFALLLYQILWPAQYRFPPATPFSGSAWYNPYAEFSGRTLKMCSHTHSSAWGGLTYGSADAEEIYNLLRDAGYDVACITNYLGITPPPATEFGVYLPAYEHVSSITKQHQTVIGASRVLWLDYPLWQGVRHKQEVIDRLANSAELVILNHPNHFDAYQLSDFDQLTGYDGVEIGTRFAQNLGYWDRALSAGRLVFGVAADDGHDPAKEGQYCRYWMQIEAEPTADAIYEAFRAGRFYSSGRRVWERTDRNALVFCRIEDGQLKVRMEEEAHLYRFIGQGGLVLKEVRAQTEASVTLRDDMPYVRVEIYTGALVQWLNPVIRYDGEHLPHPKAEVRTARTMITRGMAIGLFLWVGSLVLFRRRR